MSHDPDGEYRDDVPGRTPAEQQLAISRAQLDLQQTLARALIKWLEDSAREVATNRAEVQAETEMLKAQQPDPWVEEYRELFRETTRNDRRQALALESIAVALHSLETIVVESIKADTARQAEASS